FFGVFGAEDRAIALGERGRDFIGKRTYGERDAFEQMKAFISRTKRQILRERLLGVVRQRIDQRTKIASEEDVVRDALGKHREGFERRDVFQIAELARLGRERDERDRKIFGDAQLGEIFEDRIVALVHQRVVGHHFAKRFVEREGLLQNRDEL